MRKFVLIAVVLLGGLGAWAYASRSRMDGGDAAQRYRTERVERGAIIASVSSTGTVTPTTTVIVGSQLSGQVVEVLADFNSEVKAGQVLARLNHDTLLARHDAARAELAQMKASRQLSDAQSEKVRAEIRRAESQLNDTQAQLQRAEAQFADAETTFARQKDLKARGIATDVTMQAATTQREMLGAARRSADAQVTSSRAQIASLEADLKITEAQKLSGDAQIAKAEAQVRQIKVDIANSEIKSPVDGVVVQRNVELGQTVAASLQAPVLFLVAQNLRLIEIYVNVDEADVGRVKAGQEVEFTVNAYQARTFRGRVKQIRLGSQTVQNVVIYTTIVEVANDDMALLPGMTANLRIFTERKADVLRVSNAALRWQPAGIVRTSEPVSGQGGAPPPGDGAESAAGPFSPQPRQGGGTQMAALLETLKSELKLRPEQIAQIETLARTMSSEIQAAGADPTARREAARAARQRFSRGVDPVLDAQQRDQYRVVQEARQARGRGGANRADTGVTGRVYVLDERGTPRAITVVLGASDGAYTEVARGEVRPGDILITGANTSAGKGARQGSPFRFGF